MLDASTVYALFQRRSEKPRPQDSALGWKGHAELDYCMAYGESGYTDPESGILLANWNNVPKHVANALERRGFELEWSDEWVIDYNSNPSKAYRSQPDSYGWTPAFVLNDWSNGEIIPHDQIREDASLREDYIENMLLNDASHCDVAGLDLTQDGFSKWEEDFETGFHPGQTDNPHKVLARIQEARPDVDVVFQLDGTGQFDIHWSAWIRPRDAEDAE